MPLPENSKVEAPAAKEWEVIPEDIYQVVIKDVEEKILKKFQSEDEDFFYQFKLAILEGGEKVKGQVLSAFCTKKWFSGNKRTSPSKLVTLTKAVYAHYYPKLNVVELEADDMTGSVINDMIGKQLRIAVKVNDDKTGNKITEFMKINKEIEVSDDIKIADAPKKALKKPAGSEKATQDEEEEETEKPVKKETGKKGKSGLPF